jgi:hypothetical protein
MAKRSKVRLYEQVRRARVQDPAVSIRELARRFGVHRRDVRSALASAVPPARKVVVRAAPRMDVFKPIVDGWLAEVSVPQTHLLGAEAEVDFGTVSVYLAGVLCEVSLAARGTR